jgi:hypothetical protein
VGELLAGLPMPLGPIVTALLPVAAIGCLVTAVYAARRDRRAASAALAIVGIAALIGAVSFYGYTSGQV